MNKLEISSKKFYEGCVSAAVAHAVTVGEFPELDYEHSWKE